MVLTLAAAVYDHPLQLNRHSARFQIHRPGTDLRCHDNQSRGDRIQGSVLRVAVQERETASDHGSVESTQGWNGEVINESF